MTFLTHWRSQPGFLSQGYSDIEAINVLLGYFLRDRESSNPLNGESLLSQNPEFAWGSGAPLEKVINCDEELLHLTQEPWLMRNAIAVLEPWEHVGFNHFGEGVRASLNVAYLNQTIADCDSILFPLWSMGIPDLNRLVPLLMSGVAIVFEGGDSSCRDASSFEPSAASLEEYHQLIDRLLLSRTPNSAPCIFICIGHQLVGQSHIYLLKRAVATILETTELAGDRNGKALRTLQHLAKRIQALGESLEIHKGCGEQQTVTAKGWDHPEFVVGLNEVQELGGRRLRPYESPDSEESHIPEELIVAHDITADELEGVIDTSLAYEREVKISMFHSDEVNQEALLLANWAYRELHNTIIPHRHILAGSQLAWLLQLPYAVEILASTCFEDAVVTECAATCIYYKDFESHRIRRSFSCQFHPELLEDLRGVGARMPPSYQYLKQDDGARLFARLLYAGLQD
ncbi:MAG: hypothetical protein AAGG02_14055 [Cyanobacteria bacterium P01_H01_bin.15]